MGVQSIPITLAAKCILPVLASLPWLHSDISKPYRVTIHFHGYTLIYPNHIGLQFISMVTLGYIQNIQGYNSFPWLHSDISKPYRVTIHFHGYARIYPNHIGLQIPKVLFYVTGRFNESIVGSRWGNHMSNSTRKNYPGFTVTFMKDIKAI